MSSNNSNNSSSASSVSSVGAGDRSALSGPGVPGRVPAVNPVDRTIRPSRSQAEGGSINGQVFVTLRGNRIGRSHGRRPAMSRIGAGTYPRLDEVSEGIEIGFK